VKRGLSLYRAGESDIVEALGVPQLGMAWPGVHRSLETSVPMASIYDLKSGFQDLLRPIVRRLARMGISANAVTIMAAVLSLAVAAMIMIWPGSRWPLFLMSVWMILRMSLNAIDGMLAREHDMKSPLGAILNEMGDVVSDAALFLALASVPGVPLWPIVIFALLAILSEMMGVVAVQIGASRRYDGPLGKSDRAFSIGLLVLAIASGVRVGSWVHWYLLVNNVLLGWTTINRARKALAEVGTP
jgi:phosphatidylglycerophosphate synthase